MKLAVGDVRLLSGFAGGLTEPTALVDIAVDGAPEPSAEPITRVHAAAVAFAPDQHFYDIGDADWPTGFLSPLPSPDGPTAWLGQWLVAMTVAVQRWAHDPTWRGRVLAAESDRLELAVPWHRETVLRGALATATGLVEQWVRPDPDRSKVRRIDREFRNALDRMQAGGLNEDSLRFAECAARQGIPVAVVPGMVRYGWGAHAEYLDGTVSSRTGVLATALARNKPLTNRRLREAGVPVPRCRVVSSPEQARDAAAELGWPVVVKPPNQDTGNGVEPGVQDYTRLDRACEVAARMGGGRVIVEEHVEGLCYRLLVVHGAMIAAVRRVPAGVCGDGRQSVRDLIEQANTDPRRGRMLYRIVLDSDVLGYLKDQGLHPESVPAAGRQVWLRRTAYTESGGHHEDVTKDVHPDNVALALRITRLIGLDMAGIDLITTDVTRSWRDTGAAVCEVNAQPSLMPHWVAEPGRAINDEVLEAVFAGRPPRIPVAAVTGNGPASATALLLQRIWAAAGVGAALSTREHLQLGGETLAAAEFPGLAGVRAVLAEPTAGAAVLEVPAETVAEHGHGCDRYDAVAVLGGGPAAEILDRATALVTDDPATAGPGVVLVAGDPGAADAHRSAGGRAVVVAERDGRDRIVLADGDRETEVVAVDDLDGPAAPALAAAGLAWALGLDVGAMRAGLSGLD